MDITISEPRYCVVVDIHTHVLLYLSAPWRLEQVEASARCARNFRHAGIHENFAQNDPIDGSRRATGRRSIQLGALNFVLIA